MNSIIRYLETASYNIFIIFANILVAILFVALPLSFIFLATLTIAKSGWFFFTLMPAAFINYVFYDLLFKEKLDRFLFFKR